MLFNKNNGELRDAMYQEYKLLKTPCSDGNSVENWVSADLTDKAVDTVATTSDTIRVVKSFTVTMKPSGD